MNSVYKRVKEFKNKYPATIAWRLKANSRVVEKHVNPDEKVLYAFAAQRSHGALDIFSTSVVVLTDKRILIGRKRLLFGYFLDGITPAMFNDLKVSAGLFWGKIFIDTAKELVTLSNIDKEALDEIETNISTYMLEKKKLYVVNKDKDKN